MAPLKRLLAVAVAGFAQLASASSTPGAEDPSVFLASQPPSSNFTTDLMDTLPKCAGFYFQSAFQNAGCEVLDEEFICHNAAFFGGMRSDNSTGCTVKDALYIKNATSTACEFPVRNQFPEFAVLSETLGAISGFLVTLRLGMRLWDWHDLEYDDYLTILVICLGVPNTVNNVYGIGANGLGRDIWTLTPDTIERFWKFFFALTILYFLLVAVLKLAMLVFYMRIYTHGRVKDIIKMTMVIVCFYAALFGIFAASQCGPTEYYWNKWHGEDSGQCLNLDHLAWGNAIISIALDFWMICIPLYMLQGSKMNWKLKLGAALLFLLGTFITVVSVIRLYYLVRFRSDDPNATWDYVEICKWSTIEINIGIMCISLPTVRVAIRRLYESTKEKYRRRFPRPVHNEVFRPSRGSVDHAERVAGNAPVALDGAAEEIELPKIGT